MKANVPEKIYRTTFYLEDDKGDAKWKKTPVAGAENIEYVRTDAFIEKACEVFCKVRCKGKPPRNTCTSLGTCREYDEFKKAMKL